MKSLIWIFTILLTSFADENTFTNNQRIRNKLLKDYDNKVRPQKYHNGTTRVYVAMIPRAVLVDDVKEQLIVDSWMFFYWYDDRLTWDKKDFGNLKKVLFGDDEIWKPDLTVYNNAEISEIDHYGNTHFHVYYLGGVWWIPPAKTISHCRIDLTRWPYDTQKCQIQMSSWTSHGWEIDFRMFHNRTQMNLKAYLNTSSSWKLNNASQEMNVYQYSPESYPFQEMLFKFTLQRISPSFAPVIIVPAVLLPLLLLVQFILPVDHKKRILIGCFCAVMVLLEMLFIKSTIPRVGTVVPLIVSYYSLSFVIVVISVALSAFLGRLSHPQNPLLAFPPGQFVKLILTGPLAKILFLQDHAAKVGLSNRCSLDGEILDSTMNSPSYAHEWLLVAKVTDRIAFIVYLFIFVISLICYTA